MERHEMTLNNNQQGQYLSDDQQAEEIAAHLAAQKRFILYRTVASGWQPVGYILLAGYLSKTGDGLQFPGTAWVEDADSHWQPGQIYTADGGSGTAQG